MRLNCRFAMSGGKVSFDFDDTLTQPAWDDENKVWEGSGANQKMIQTMRDLAAAGNTIYIVTSRHRSKEPELRKQGKDVASFVRQYDLPVDEQNIVFTDGELKGKVLASLGISMHFDDWGEDVQSARDLGITVHKVPHPQDEVMSKSVPDDPDEARRMFSEDQLRFWEWHKRDIQGDENA